MALTLSENRALVIMLNPLEIMPIPTVKAIGKYPKPMGKPSLIPFFNWTVSIFKKMYPLNLIKSEKTFKGNKHTPHSYFIK